MENDRNITESIEEDDVEKEVEGDEEEFVEGEDETKNVEEYGDSEDRDCHNANQGLVVMDISNPPWTGDHPLSLTSKAQ